MKRAKLIYLILLLSLTAFYILYIGELALILLVAAILLPVILFVSIRWLHHCAEVTLQAKASACQAGASVPLYLTVKSRCPLPFTRIKTILSIRHSLVQDEETLQFCFPLQPHNTTRLTFRISAEYCGNITITLKKAYAWDVLCLFRTKLHCNVHSVELLVIPECVPLPVQLMAPPLENMDSTEYDSRPGDDPSEILGVHEYQPGDAVSRIHWKLSAKSEEIFVKEFGRPISREILICLDYTAKNASNAKETMLAAKGWLTMVYSLSSALLEQNKPHLLLWHETNGIQMTRISGSEALLACFGKLYLTMQHMELPESFLIEALEAKQFSSITCITNYHHPELAFTLDKQLDGEKKNWISITNTPSEMHMMQHTEIFQILPNHIQDGFLHLIL